MAAQNQEEGKEYSKPIDDTMSQPGSATRNMLTRTAPNALQQRVPENASTGTEVEMGGGIAPCDVRSL